MNSKLKEARKAKGLTQMQLAKLVELKKATISAIERGQICGSIETWKALALALDVSLDYLLDMPDLQSAQSINNQF